MSVTASMILDQGMADAYRLLERRTGRHRRRGRSTQAPDYQPTHDGTQEPRVDLVATLYDYQALLDGHTARAIDRILRGAA